MPDVRSAEMEQIIGKAPKWIVRWGIIVIGVVIVLIIVAAGFIKYPEIISAPVVISAANPPVKIMAPVTGRIIEINCNDGDKVAAGKIIAVVENAARTSDVARLKELTLLLDSSVDVRHLLMKIDIPPNLQVGEMQAEYASLVQSINNWKFIAQNKYYTNKINALRQQQLYNDHLKNTIHQRGQLLDKLLTIESIKDSANKFLRNEKVIAPLEYNEIQKGAIGQKLSINDNQTAEWQNELQRTEYQKGISDIEQQYKVEENNAVQQVRDQAKRIKGTIAAWEKQYLLRAPVDGTITFFQWWKENQYVTANAQVFALLPGDTDLLDVRASLPLYKSGKVKQGQLAYIKLQQYPYEEYGMVKAKIKLISTAALDGNYAMHLVLDNGMYTTLKKQIPAAPEMTGTIDIVTESKSILQRIFEKAYGKLH